MVLTVWCLTLARKDVDLSVVLIGSSSLFVIFIGASSFSVILTGEPESRKDALSSRSEIESVCESFPFLIKAIRKEGQRVEASVTFTKSIGSFET